MELRHALYGRHGLEVYGDNLGGGRISGPDGGKIELTAENLRRKRAVSGFEYRMRAL